MFSNILRSYNTKKCIDSSDFDKVKAYYQNGVGEKYKTKRRVLVELLFFHPAANHASLVIAALLSKKYDAKKFALVESGLSFPEVSFARKFGVKNFVNVYSLTSLVLLLKSIANTLMLLGKLTYDKKTGIEVRVDEVEIGRFIYDQYLRENSLPTMRKITAKYLFSVANGIYLYFRYKDILNNVRPTDIVMSHNVYSKYGLIGIAAWSVDKSINIWQAFNLNPMNISCVKPSKNYVSPPRYYTKKWGEVLIDYYGFENLISEYASEIERRYKGSNKNDLDLEYVYKNNEIETQEAFFACYENNSAPIFIFSHAFVDAVKYTKWQVFSDYYTWLEETLVLLSKKSMSRTIYVKPHPSEKLYPCDETVYKLVTRVNRDYDANFLFLDKKIHNKVIFQIADLVITSNGTVGMEAVAAGVPVIVAASCEYEEAEIVHQAHCLDEYKSLLSEVDSIPKPSTDMINRAKICILAYSKYMYTHATFLRNLNRLPLVSDEMIKNELNDLNGAYKEAASLEKQVIYKQFSYMISENLENCIYLDPMKNQI